MAETYQLFYYDSCGYCQRVLRFLADSTLVVELRQVQLDPTARAELIAGSGSSQVPCLRISREDGSEQWLHESLDIIAYLQTRQHAD